MDITINTGISKIVKNIRHIYLTSIENFFF
jgi:hypothetical protein